MKLKIFCILAFVCFLNLFSSAKQLGLGCIKKCDTTRTAQAKPIKPSPAKAKKPTASSSARPFDFYLFNI
jgi:hypothetical protein